MPSAPLIDIAALLNPISDESPSGSDCREDPSPTSYYQQIKSARNAARSAERNNLYTDASDEADEHWRTVVGLAPNIIATQSKDLEVACWYAEAMVRRHGFAGLRDSILLIEGLVGQYWDHLYPMPDEDGLETRVSPLAGLNGEGAEGVLLAPIRNTVITQGSSAGPFSYWEYQQAVEAQRLVDHNAREDKIKNLGYSLETVEKAVMESEIDFFVSQRDDLRQAIQSYKAVSAKLDELCGSFDAPPTRNILNLLEECLGAINHLGEGKFPIEQEPVTDADSATAETVKNEGPAGASGPVSNKEQALKQIRSVAEFIRKSDPSSAIPFVLEQAVKADSAGISDLAREQAFKQLREIAEFFRKTEPHSPVPYLLERAVKWGGLSLAELVKELIPNDSSLEHFSLLTGVSTEE